MQDAAVDWQTSQVWHKYLFIPVFMFSLTYMAAMYYLSIVNAYKKLVSAMRAVFSQYLWNVWTVFENIKKKKTLT